MELHDRRKGNTYSIFWTDLCRANSHHFEVEFDGTNLRVNPKRKLSTGTETHRVKKLNLNK